MDVSVFIANKRRFWTWILAPLVIRFVLVSAAFGLTAKSLSVLDEETTAANVVGVLLQECDENRELLKRYEVDSRFPINEQFYKMMDAKNNQYGLDFGYDVSMKTSKTKKVMAYELSVGGELPSVYLASRFVADLLDDPLMSLKKASFSSKGSNRRGRRSRSSEEGSDPEEPTFELSCVFEKLALKKPAGGTQ